MHCQQFILRPCMEMMLVTRSDGIVLDLPDLSPDSKIGI